MFLIQGRIPRRLKELFNLLLIIFYKITDLLIPQNQLDKNDYKGLTELYVGMKQSPDSQERHFYRIKKACILLQTFIF